MGTCKLTEAEAAALHGQNDSIATAITYPNPNMGSFPILEQTSFYRNLVALAAGIPLVAEPNFKPPIVFFDDFLSYDDTATGKWVLAGDTGSTAAIADGVEGWLSIDTDGTDNDGTVVASVIEVFSVANATSLAFEARVKGVEGNTNVNAWFIGLSDVVTVDLIADAGATLAGSIDAIGFLKISEALTVDFYVANGATQTHVTTVATIVSGTAVRLGFTVEPYIDKDGVGSATKARVTPYVNGVAGTALDMLLASADAMQVALAMKTGGHADDALKVDYVMVAQGRA